MKSEEIKAGVNINRLPYVKKCSIVKIDDDNKKALVNSGSYATWVNYSTLIKKWCLAQ